VGGEGDQESSWSAAGAGGAAGGAGGGAGRSAGCTGAAGAGRLSPPKSRHPHLGMVAEVDLQVDDARLEHSVVVQEAAALDAAQAKESRACV
jgi:hypothetical protein